MAIRSISLTTSAAQPIVETAFGQSVAVTTVYLCNKTPVNCTVNVYAVDANALAGGSNIIYSNLVIAGNDTYVMEAERLILAGGDLLSANASINGAVIATASFVGI
jgi:Na+-transporting NADH:ubiquinone oxidoreductase subunit NqrE